MNIIAFLVGFSCVAFFAVPGIAAGDPEPIGAEASLYLFGFLAAAICSTCFAVSAARRSIPAAIFVAAAIGALTSAAFYLAAATAFPALPLVVALAAALALSMGFASGAPRLFRPAPNNSFKADGSAAA